MEMMNRAIEGASDFQDMLKKLQQPLEFARREPIARPAVAGAVQAPKRPGENRAQYRARLRAMEAAQ